MKARPIIFSTDMVRAILAGTKTQTRRAVKVQPPENTSGCVQVWEGENHWDFWGFNGSQIKRVKCPYGVVGDQLWVRETYAKVTNRQGNQVFVYKADQSDEFIADYDGGWDSSMFMPRAASRILLEITAIRVERVQDISEADAIAEGSYLNRCPCPQMQAKPRSAIDAMFKQTHCHIHGMEYSRLWELINGKKHPWSESPWVWVVEFKRVEHSHE